MDLVKLVGKTFIYKRERRQILTVDKQGRGGEVRYENTGFVWRSTIADFKRWLEQATEVVTNDESVQVSD